MWVRWASPGCWGTFTHTSTLDKSPLRNPDWLPQRDHVPRATVMIPQPHWQRQTPGNDGHTWHQGLLCPATSGPFPLLLWKGAQIKHPMALHTAWGGTRKTLCGQRSARKGSATPEGHVGELGSPGPQATGQGGQVEAQIPCTGTGIHPTGEKPSHSHRLTCILDEEASR